MIHYLTIIFNFVGLFSYTSIVFGILLVNIIINYTIQNFSLHY